MAQLLEIDLEAAADIAKFDEQLQRYLAGDLPEDVFRVFRLNNGIYGQRQGGTNQMVRVKVPYGRINAEQLEMLASISEQYSRGWGHLTTRQNAQFHFVELRDTPVNVTIVAPGPVDTAMWDHLEEASDSDAMLKRLRTLQLIPKVSPERLARRAVFAVKLNRRHVRTPLRLSSQFWLNEAPRRINEIVQGHRAITADTAARLAAFFGVDAEGWLALQAHYDTEMVRERLSDVLAHIPRYDHIRHNPIAARTASI